MQNRAKWIAVGMSLAFLLGGAAAGVAQDKLADVTQRQNFMKAQGADVKAITEYSKGQGDQQKALTAVNDLLARAPKIADQFPAGTSATDFPGKTKAKPEIWTDMDNFKKIPTALQGEEVKLKAAIEGGDPKAVAAQLGATGKAGCGACHSKYRLPLT
jgi:cytochrome c556